MSLYPRLDMLCSLGKEEGGRKGWLASPGSPRSRRLAHDMLDAGSA